MVLLGLGGAARSGYGGGLELEVARRAGAAAYLARHTTHLGSG
jgi:hypothetical protein